MATLILAVDHEVMHHPNLDLLDKLILSYCLNWEKKKNCCFAKDGFLAGLFGVKESEVHFSLIKLESLGLIEQIHGLGGRLIRSKQKQKEQTPVHSQDIFNI